ncbi:hypothetical protein SAMN04515665_12431 [Blastococcus sp. DSM 46786]|uniref:hypothetical protein n=1 Tax=Blastococcus sp. DSM 46786 TaxID=1798227 RepID=UPI0008BD72D0|nr:hypothetical protein [Blastococcus sp. DSM 46786]SEL95391.1 hypothetical protein SAMN04515665_12431 [Blastococcus sp. DSM 46786]
MPEDELDRLRADVVEPVARSVLRDDEFESAELWREDGVAPDEIWVRVVARGEMFRDLLSSPSWEGFERAGPGALAARLADHLEDWVCETRFAWGERRRADPTARR